MWQSRGAECRVGGKQGGGDGGGGGGRAQAGAAHEPVASKSARPHHGADVVVLRAGLLSFSAAGSPLRD